MKYLELSILYIFFHFFPLYPFFINCQNDNCSGCTFSTIDSSDSPTTYKCINNCGSDTGCICDQDKCRPNLYNTNEICYYCDGLSSSKSYIIANNICSIKEIESSFIFDFDFSWSIFFSIFNQFFKTFLVLKC